MNKYLVLFHLTDIEQSVEEWGKFSEFLNSRGKFLGGSALAKPLGLKNGNLVNSVSNTVGGYMVLNATSQDEVFELVKNSPSHTKNGLVEIFHLL